MWGIVLENKVTEICLPAGDTIDTKKASEEVSRPAALAGGTLGDKVAFGNNILGQWGSLVFFAGLVYLVIKHSFFSKIEE